MFITCVVCELTTLYLGSTQRKLAIVQLVLFFSLPANSYSLYLFLALALSGSGVEVPMWGWGQVQNVILYIHRYRCGAVLMMEEQCWAFTIAVSHLGDMDPYTCIATLYNKTMNDIMKTNCTFIIQLSCFVQNFGSAFKCWPFKSQVNFFNRGCIPRALAGKYQSSVLFFLYE